MDAGNPAATTYLTRARECIDALMEYGTDRYGALSTPLVVSILDSETMTCPRDPAPLDEYVRVTRRGRRNPAGSNLMTDQPLLRALQRLSARTGDARYAEFARCYAEYVMERLVDPEGFFWWGWHRHYDVYTDTCEGHNGNPHELHALFEIDWEFLHDIRPSAVRREIEAIWKHHVIDKETGEVNRHGDGHRGCDFSMSAGAHLQAFSFLYARTNEAVWRDRARLLAAYYWRRRNPETDLFPERPNAGADRFDGSTFASSIPGLHCYSLLRAWQWTGDGTFREYAAAYLKAYARYGFDEAAGKFWGALRLDGTPVAGPRVYTDNVDSAEGYLAAQPRGYLDLWQPYVAGYEHPIHAAQAYAFAYRLTGEPDFLAVAERFARWIARTPPGGSEHETAWYRAYSRGPGREGAYAGQYGRAVSFFLTLSAATGDPAHLQRARAMADTALEKLRHPSGLLRGHPAKPYYEAVDGVGYLLVALLQLDATLASGTDERLANW